MDNKEKIKEWRKRNWRINWELWKWGERSRKWKKRRNRNRKVEDEEGEYDDINQEKEIYESKRKEDGNKLKMKIVYCDVKLNILKKKRKSRINQNIEKIKGEVKKTIKKFSKKYSRYIPGTVELRKKIKLDLEEEIGKNIEVNKEK